ncbi:hydroxymethylpyrimidine ABC transporter, transmembrane component [Sporolactobacillus inulinus]|uniref:Hydroxymethylpyrimidine ABC transporter, transmembrane component n=1 Tax=Sporolactobacillus inulinus TaxID=2078 RepID=A0A4Y1Z769_9BACL|nr:hydroxymethylpyrimidine ABC transporter, transmembrane component [Sporolactobacillus inulinus]
MEVIVLAEKDKSALIIEDPTVEQTKLRRRAIVGQIILGALLIVFWELFSRIGWLDSYYWSSPSTIVRTGWTAIVQGNLLQDLAYTSGSTIIGFILGTAAGYLLGLTFWWSDLYSRIFEPYLIAFNAVPKLALAPVLVIMFGIGFDSKVVLAFLMTIIVAAIAAYSGVENVDKDLEKMLVSLGAKRHHVFMKVVVPTTIPWIVSILKINISLALAGTIVGEFISSRQGIGRMILYAGQVLDIDLVWVGVVVLSILSIVMYLGTVWLEHVLMKGRTPKS